MQCLFLLSQIDTFTTKTSVKKAVFEDMLAVMFPVFLRTVEKFDKICPKGVTKLEKKNRISMWRHTVYF